MQLFTGPVAAATQALHGEIGQSLTNAADRYATAVWTEFFADQDQPPTWIERTLLAGTVENEFVLATFDVVDEYTLGGRDWNTITSSELGELVGAEVDGGRGEQHVPMPEDVFLPVYTTTPVANLPMPTPFREDCLIEDTPARAKTLRRLHRGRRAKCCWYHQGDWHAVSESAIRLVRAAQDARIAPLEISAHVQDAGHAEGIDAWSSWALKSLVAPGIGIQISRAPDGELSFANGQHRTRALLGAGVNQVLVVDFKVVER